MASTMTAAPEVAEPDSQINHTDAKAYWQTVEADVDGMLGGYPYVSRIDLQGSKNFLAKLGVGERKKRFTRNTANSTKAGEMEQNPGSGNLEADDGRLKKAVDCGAGIGRITQGLLLNVARSVDIVEPIAKFSEGLRAQEGIGRIFNVGLEEWTPEVEYDLMWNQWCVGHLTDVQLVMYLVNCGKSLSSNGWIIVKENLSTNIHGKDLFDDCDSSVTRTESKFQQIFERAGLKIKKTELQKGMPKELYPVRMWALQPVSHIES